MRIIVPPREVLSLSSVAQGALMRAASKVGHAELATRLGISRMKLFAYIGGFAQIPDDILLSALDVLVEGLYAKPPASETAQDSGRDR